MPRLWADLDTDAHRLPSGFTRTGYDSNTRRYQFTDPEGRVYQGEPGEEFGGRLTLTHGVDPSMKQRFAQGDDEAEGQDVLYSPPNSLETDSPRPIFTPAEQNTGTTPGIVPSFADFLSSTQMATAAPPKPPQKNATNHGSTLSFKRVTASFMGFRSTKSRGKASTLPNLPPTEADEWGVAKSPHSTRF